MITLQPPDANADDMIYETRAPQPDYSCIMERARRHVALGEAERLPEFTPEEAVDLDALAVTPPMLADAYFTGRLEESLKQLSAHIPANPGDARNEAFDKLRWMKRSAAEAAAGDCLPESAFANEYNFHRTGLAKASVMEEISDAYKEANRVPDIEDALRR